MWLRRLEAFFAMAVIVCCTIVIDAQDRKPQVVPFALDGGGAAFLITVANTTAGTLSLTANGFCRMKLDGNAEGPDHGGSSGIRAVAPGASWREILRLVTWPRDPSGRRPQNPRPDAAFVYREKDAADLPPGLHTLTFTCGGDSSDTLSFNWSGK
jgi:hypothetical protein